MLVGYKLIRDSDQTEIETWGGAWGSYPNKPNPLRLPNGDQVHAPSLNTSYGGFTLIEWLMDPPPPAPLTADDVRREAQRRIIVLVGASDLNGCIIKQLNANMRANELNDIRHTRELDTAEAAEAATLRGLADQIKAIRAASNVLEPNPPSDFTADIHWP